MKQKYSQTAARARAVLLHFLGSISPISTVFPLTEGSFLDVGRDLSNISTQSCTDFQHLYQKQEALLLAMTNKCLQDFRELLLLLLGIRPKRFCADYDYAGKNNLEWIIEFLKENWR